MARKLEASRAKTIFVAVHPGVSPTNLHQTSGFITEKIITPLISQSTDKAALPSLLPATDPAVANGSYWDPKGSSGPAVIPTRAKDVTATGRLWELGKTTNWGELFILMIN